MKNIIALGGSTSKNSINKTLANYAANQLQGVAVNSLELREFNLPLYSIDEETANGIHSEATRLNEEFKKADGFIVSLAEHNGNFSAAFKNAYDWLSRIDMKVWKEKPVLILATSPGPGGAKSVLGIATASFPYLGAQVTGSFSLPSFFENFKDNVISDEGLQANLAAEIANFASKI